MTVTILLDFLTGAEVIAYIVTVMLCFRYDCKNYFVTELRTAVTDITEGISYRYEFP